LLPTVPTIQQITIKQIQTQSKRSVFNEYLT
jgi:hypothetical protein